MNPDVNSQKLDQIHSSAADRINGDVTSRRRYRLFGNGVDSVPFRQFENQLLPLVKQDDPPQLKPVDVMDAKAQVFDMANATDLTAYNQIIDMVAKQRAAISTEQIQWSEKRDNFIIFMRWLELFIEAPDRGPTYEEVRR